MNHDNWDLLTEGGYASIFINSNKEIMKVMPKYVEENGVRCINSHAIIELIVLCSYKGIIDGIPQITKYIVDNDSIRIFMPYYGTTLNKSKIPKDKIPHVATKLLEILLSLEANGIQHTDIKPCNVLLSSDFEKVTLIDFNIASFELHLNSYSVWSKAYGTWNFCAPEVLLHTKPSKTSSVWSFGLILAYMYNRFPLINAAKYDIKALSSRTFWKNIMKDLHSKHPDGIILPPSHVAVMPLDMVLLYQKCMRWQPQDRPRLHDIYAEISGSCYQGFNVKNVATMNLSKCSINMLSQACSETNTSAVFSLVLAVYNSIYEDVSGYDDNELMGVCHAIALILIDLYDDHKQQLCKIWNNTDLEMDVWDLCSYKKWDILSYIPKTIFKDIKKNMSNKRI